MKKRDLIRKNMVESVNNERNILAMAQNPFVVRFYYSFTSRENLYIVMEYINGGDCYRCAGAARRPAVRVGCRLWGGCVCSCVCVRACMQRRCRAQPCTMLVACSAGSARGPAGAVAVAGHWPRW